MPIKDILVLCDAGEANDYRVETALLLAKVYQAHLTGLHLIPYPVIPVYGGGFPDAIPYLSSEQLEQSQNTANALKDKFKKKAADLEVPCDWKSIDGVDVRYIIDSARYTDVVIVPQGYCRYGEDNTQKIDDYLSIHLGRPLIVTPDLKKVFNLPKRVVIAWNESHEAARAVHDALPFLQYAEQIQVVSVAASAKQEKKYMIYDDDLRKHLSHHGIDVEVRSLDPASKGTGKTILESALEYDADLIVMGAYGHTRLKEIVLGGATKYLLRHSTVPLFLSH
ncbi:MAG: universal stress protein [Gammaproteobacteria bacterium]|nr:universal stress protein [Gammaproteobacteria bacterium]